MRWIRRLSVGAGLGRLAGAPINEFQEQRESVVPGRLPLAVEALRRPSSGNPVVKRY